MWLVIKSGSSGWWPALRPFAALGFFATLALSSPIQAAEPRIGDPESVHDPALDDPRFPQMREWAQAGVQGGIPRVENILATLQPGDDLVANLAEIYEQTKNIETPGPKGVVLLEPGDYEINDSNSGDRYGVVGTFALLWLPKGIVLRGKDRDTTVIRYKVTVDTHEGKSEPTNARYALGLSEWSGVENLTLINKAVEEIDPTVYMGKYDNFDVAGGKIGGVGSFGADEYQSTVTDKKKPLNGWVQNCKILKSGSHPVMIERVSHVTLRDNIVDIAMNKGDGGAGYYFLFGAWYVLAYNETISNIRHVSVQDCQYCVMHSLLSRVDVNWHSGDAMRFGLLERSRVEPREGHPWGAIAHYVDPVKEGNLLYQVLPAYETGIWALRENYEEEPWIYDVSDGLPPVADTLYPVTGQHLPPPDCDEEPDRCKGAGGGSGGLIPGVSNDGGGGADDVSADGGAEGCGCRMGAQGGSSAAAMLCLLALGLFRRRVAS